MPGQYCEQPIAHALLALVIALIDPRVAESQAAEDLDSVHDPIPRANSSGLPYKSWSLFLVCNSEWLLPQNSDRLASLYDQFQAFGQAIGPEHVAVWFSKEPRSSPSFDRSTVDVDRSAAFCSKLMLPPSEGPYVVVSTKYPGEGIFARYPRTFPSDLGHHARLELNDASAETIIRLLDEISDQLVTDNFANFDPDSKRYWQKWRDIYLAVRDRLVGTFDNITVTIDAGVLKTEIPLSAAPNR